MDIWQLLGTVARRWYVTVPVLVIAVTSSILITSSISPSYEVEGTVVLVGATAGETDTLDEEGLPAQQNPFLRFSSSLHTTARAIELILNGDAMRTDFEDAGLSPDYEVAIDARAPIFSLTVATDDPRLSEATLDAVVERIDQELLVRQAALGAPEEELITSQILSTSPEAIENTGARQRALILFGVVSLALAAAAAVAVDGWRRRRVRPRPSDRRSSIPTDELVAQVADVTDGGEDRVVTDTPALVESRGR